MKKILVSSLIIFTGLFHISFSQINLKLLVESTSESFANPQISKSGNILAYTTVNYTGIYLYNLTTGEKKELTNETAAGFGMIWSNNDSKIIARPAVFENKRRFNGIVSYDINNLNREVLSEFSTSLSHLPSITENALIIPEKHGIKTSNLNGDNSILSGGKSVFLYNDKIAVYDIQSQNLSFLTPVANERYLNVKSNPAGDLVSFEVIGGNLYLVNISGNNLIDLGKGYRATWSPDGKYIVFMVTEDDGHYILSSKLVVADRQGNIVKTVFDNSSFLPSDPIFLGNNYTVAFADMISGNIYSFDIEGGLE
ncbi:MAG: PD40 domain-containing protein [Ignavibacteriaceae bacterium]|nr:PD40 domain-containing protein [Ignavibacteriaceae bacterium]